MKSWNFLIFYRTAFCWLSKEKRPTTLLTRRVHSKINMITSFSKLTTPLESCSGNQILIARTNYPRWNVSIYLNKRRIKSKRAVRPTAAKVKNQNLIHYLIGFHSVRFWSSGVNISTKKPAIHTHCLKLQDSRRFSLNKTIATNKRSISMWSKLWLNRRRKMYRIKIKTKLSVSCGAYLCRKLPPKKVWL